MAIDLGTVKILVILKGQGEVLNEAAVVEIVEENGKKNVIAVGDEAEEMSGRTKGSINVKTVPELANRVTNTAKMISKKLRES